MQSINFKEGVVKTVAKTGGIIFEDEPNTWYNPEKIKKNMVIPELRGKRISLTLAEGNNFIALQVSDKQPEENPHVIKIAGKDYVTHEGLVKEATEKGLIKVNTSIISFDWDKKVCLARAEVTMIKEGNIAHQAVFSGLGSGTPENLKKMVENNFVEMAETRAVNRALRIALGRGATTAEEMRDGTD